MNKSYRYKKSFLTIVFIFLLTLIALPAFAKQSVYPEWKVKLAYTLLAKGIEVNNEDPELAEEYYKRAQKIYPLIKKDKEYTPAVPKATKTEKKPYAQTTDQETPSINENVQFAQKIEEEKSIAYQKDIPKQISEKKLESLPIQESEDVIIAELDRIAALEVYSAEKKGPITTKLLDPYYIKHKNFKIPYYKDREGLKVHPWLGIRGEYQYDEQRVGIESLLMEAKEFNQRRNDQARDYISINKKELYREEVILHIREWLPKFTFINHEEKVKRVYKAKKLWSSNDTFYDNYNRRYYQLEYTIPRLKKLGYLKLKLRYGDELSYRTNDPAAYLPYESHLVGFETSPHISRLGRVKIKFEYEYWNGEYKQAGNQGWSEREAYDRNYLLECELYNQKKFLRITPHFSWDKEQHSPSHDTWWTKKTGLKTQKNINGKLVYTTDWTYIRYVRVNPTASNEKKISASCWTWENELEYEIVRDLKFTLGLDYSNGLGFDAFDSITTRGEIMLRKPGLIDLRFGYRYTDYINLNDNVDTVYFKFGWFI